MAVKDPGAYECRDREKDALSHNAVISSRSWFSTFVMPAHEAFGFFRLLFEIF
jgi:hypothetical protein